MSPVSIKQNALGRAVAPRGEGVREAQIKDLQRRMLPVGSFGVNQMSMLLYGFSAEPVRSCSFVLTSKPT